MLMKKKVFGEKKKGVPMYFSKPFVGKVDNWLKFKRRNPF
jgi:hypothetical protein